jgi:anti-anti-sigma factor
MLASLFSRWMSRPAASPPPPAPGLEVTVRGTPDGVRIRVRGEADDRQAGPLQADLLDPAALRAEAVTLDLSGLRSLSGLALSVLAAYRGGVGRRGGRVRLLPQLQPEVRAALERAGVLELFADGGAASARRPSGAAGSGPEGLRALEREHGVTWEELTAREPELTALLGQAQHAAVACRSGEGADWVFSPFRRRLSRLIGSQGKHHEHPVLGSPGAYQVADHKLRDALGRLPPRGPAARAVV